MVFDFLIKSGHIVDGAGNPWFKADVAIENGRIAQIGRIASYKAERVINAKGLIVCPGFIDIHSHSDFVLLINPKAESKIRQGITTEIIGNCGNSLAPLKNETMHFIKERTNLASEINWDWLCFGEYLQKIEKQGIAINIASLVGHGTIRIAVMGFEQREPTKDELEEMKYLISKSMEEGAFGLSTGLIYPPGYYSTTEELIELCKVVSKYNGFYATHIRSESDKLIEATREAIYIAELACLPLHLSHYSCKYPCNRVGGNKKTMEMIDEARARGLDINCDLHGYDRVMTNITTLLPPWTFEGGGEKLLERLKNPKLIEQIKKQMAGTLPVEWPRAGSSCLMRDRCFDKVYLAECKKNRTLCGKSFSEIAKIMELEPYEVIFKILLDEEDTTPMITSEAYYHENNKIVLTHNTSMIATDGSSLAPYGILSESLTHPRSYGCFPNIFSKYVREEKLLLLEEAVRKMTSFPAQRLGLGDRGLLLPQMRADITIFEPMEIRSMATYAEPHKYPIGIKYVLVNGQLVFEKETHTGTLSGIVIRHKY